MDRASAQCLLRTPGRSISLWPALPLVANGEPAASFNYSLFATRYSLFQLLARFSNTSSIYCQFIVKFEKIKSLEFDSIFLPMLPARAGG